MANDIGRAGGGPAGGGPTPRTTGRAGDLIGGRYTLSSPIARGGMAEVWEGNDQTLDRSVAVKLLHAHLATDSGFITRFRREAVAAAQLNHPNVVAVFDTGVDRLPDGTSRPFIVMELVRGESLRARMRNPIPLQEVVSIIGQAADGLEYAHRAGLVHRDVKPANVLVRPDGRVQVADFGIAKAVLGPDLPEPRSQHETVQEDLTQAGAILGTAKYLAPEQVDGKQLDARTDVYALGVVLYESLVGQPPFVGANDLATAMAHVREAPVPPRRLKAGIPAPLEAVVMRALAKDPAGRFPSAAAFAHALRSVDLRADDAWAAVSRSPAEQTPPRGLHRQPRSTVPNPGAAADVGSDATRFDPQTKSSRVPSSAANADPTMLEAGAGRSRNVRTPRPTGRQPHAGPVDDRGRSDLVTRSRRRWPAAVAVLAGLVTGAPTGWLGQGFTTSSNNDTLRVLVAQSVNSFDPFGDGKEFDSKLSLAIDGDPNTYWSTFPGETHADGVGLYLTFSSPVEVLRVRVNTGTAQWSGAIYGLNGAVGEQGEGAQEFAQWGDPIGTVDSGSVGTEVVKVRSRPVTRLLVWFRDLGPDRQVIVREVEALGR